MQLAEIPEGNRDSLPDMRKGRLEVSLYMNTGTGKPEVLLTPERCSMDVWAGTADEVKDLITVLEYALILMEAPKDEGS